MVRGDAEKVREEADFFGRIVSKDMVPPTIEDIKKLIQVLKGLVDNGNTVVTIEHNLDFIRNADWCIDLGPEGGEGGGYIVAEGTPKQIAKNKKSYTGQFLRAS